MLTNENDSRSSDLTIRPSTDANTRVGPPNDSMVMVENDGSSNPSSNYPPSSENELMDAKLISRPRSNSAPVSAPPGFLPSSGLGQDNSTTDNKWTPQSPFSSRYFASDKGDLTGLLSDTINLAPAVLGTSTSYVPQKGLENNIHRSPDGIVDSGRVVSPLDGTGSTELFRDSHGLGSAPRRGSFTEHQGQGQGGNVMDLGMGIADQGNRRGNIGSSDSGGPSIVLNLDEQMQAQASHDEGDPLSPTTAQSLMFLLQEERQKFEVLNTIRPQTQQPQIPKSPAPFPQLGGQGGSVSPFPQSNSPALLPQPSPPQPNTNSSLGHDSWLPPPPMMQGQGQGLGQGLGQGMIQTNQPSQTSTMNNTSLGSHSDQQPSLVANDSSEGSGGGYFTPFRQSPAGQLLHMHDSHHGSPLHPGSGGGAQGIHDAFGMDAMEQSLPSADMNHKSNNGGSPYHHQQFQSLNQQQQQQDGGYRMSGQGSMRPQLPPRSPQVIHPVGQHNPSAMGPPYGTPTRHRAVSLPPAMQQQQQQANQQSPHYHQQGPQQPYYHNNMNNNYQTGMSENSISQRVESPIGSEFSYGSYGSAGGHQASPASPQSNAYYQLADTNLAPYDGPYFQVQFKRCHRCFILSPAAPGNVKPGDFVMVEGDRGEDLGVVVAMAPRDSPMITSIFAACASTMARGAADGSVTDHHAFKKILRMASMQERLELPLKIQDETDLLEVCRERARELYCLPMTLVDAEYQFDRHKLILYYSASRRIDFRELVRDLFAMYKTRIWMEQATTHHSFRPSEAAARALTTGLLQHSSITDANGQTVAGVGGPLVGSGQGSAQGQGLGSGLGQGLGQGLGIGGSPGRLPLSSANNMNSSMMGGDNTRRRSLSQPQPFRGQQTEQGLGLGYQPLSGGGLGGIGIAHQSPSQQQQQQQTPYGFSPHRDNHHSNGRYPHHQLTSSSSSSHTDHNSNQQYNHQMEQQQHNYMYQQQQQQRPKELVMDSSLCMGAISNNNHNMGAGGGSGVGVGGFNNMLGLGMGGGGGNNISGNVGVTNEGSYTDSSSNVSGGMMSHSLNPSQR